MYLFRGDCLGLKDQHPGCGSLAAVSSQAGGHPALQFLLTPATLSGKQSSTNLSPRITAIRKNSIWTELRSRFKARQQENTNPPAATLVLASGFVCVRALKKCGTHFLWCSMTLRLGVSIFAQWWRQPAVGWDGPWDVYDTVWLQMILAAFKSLTPFLSLPLSLSLLSTSLCPSFSQKIRYRHPSIPKCSLQLQGVQNFKLHRSLLQSLAGHLHLLPIPGLVESVRARPHVHVTTPSHSGGSCFDVTGARAGDAEDLQARNAETPQWPAACVTCDMQDWPACCHFLAAQTQVLHVFFSNSRLWKRRKSFF